jgi:hypothetical protein
MDGTMPQWLRELACAYFSKIKKKKTKEKENWKQVYESRDWTQLFRKLTSLMYI